MLGEIGFESGLGLLNVVGAESDGRLGGIFSRCCDDGKREAIEYVSSASLNGYWCVGHTHQSISAT